MDFLSDESNKYESELIIELLNDTGLQSLEYNVHVHTRTLHEFYVR